MVSREAKKGKSVETASVLLVETSSKGIENKAPWKPLSQRVHVGIWYILRAQRGSHIPTLRPKYIPYTYMDPLGIRLRV